jgi:hypothetical protein
MAKIVRLDQIRLDGGTQMREHLDQNVVQDYAEKMRSGIVFPPLVTMFDGSTHWLVDGFHRYLAVQAAGKQGYNCEVHNGTQQDAIFMATSVNGSHGLQRSNDTKRKAVEVTLAHPKADGWSNVQIAKHCCVSDMFVASIRNPEIKQKQAENRARSIEKQVMSNLQNKDDPSIGLRSDEDFGPSSEELRAQEFEEQANQQYISELIAADDKLAHADAEVKRLLKAYSKLEARFEAVMDEKAEAIKMVKSLQKQLDKAKK